MTSTPDQDKTKEQLIAELQDLRTELETRRHPHHAGWQMHILNSLDAILNEVYIFDAISLQFQYVNTAAKRNIGYTMEQMLTLTPIDLLAEFDRESFHQCIEPLFSHQQEKLIFETVHLRANGSFYPIELHLQLMEPEAEGESSFLAVVLDITERKQSYHAALRKAKDDLEMRVAERTAELISLNRRLQLELEERKQIEEALRISQARFAGILEIAEDAIISVNANQHITLFNQGAEKIFGYTASEILGQPLDILLPGRFAAIHRQHVVDFGKDQEHSRKMGDRREIFGRRKGGVEFPAEASISKLELAGETIFTVILRDITERKQVQRMKDEFVSVVSHELRTPLTSIHGSLGMLASGLLKAQPEKAQRLLEIAVDSTERLVRLINDILDIERIESGKVKMEKQICNAADLMQEAAAIMQSMAEKIGIQLSVSPVLASVWADPDRMIQTLTNLLSNAIKFSPPRSTIWLSAELINSHSPLVIRQQSCGIPQGKITDDNEGQITILFKVEDQGRGIPTDKLETIFERFQQVDASDSRKHDGTGLGLAICRSIVQQHGGQIWAESQPGEGSKFYFTLPVLKKERTITPVAASANPLLLVCDDDPSIQVLLQTMLEHRGYRVVTVSSGKEAVEQAVKQQPDAILLDLLMPEMNGWETLAALRERTDTKNIPIIICSVCSPEESNIPPTDFVNWVGKPLDESSLFQSLRQALTQQSKRLRVLLVEDDTDLAQVLITLLERHDIETVYAQTGREAIRLCQEVKPDLLILELILPDWDGFAVVQWLQQHSYLHSLPLVVYSAQDLGHDERDRLRLGQTEFLTKSRVTTQEFEQRVMELLQGITQNQGKSGGNDE